MSISSANFVKKITFVSLADFAAALWVDAFVDPTSGCRDLVTVAWMDAFVVSVSNLVMESWYSFVVND